MGHTFLVLLLSGIFITALRKVTNIDVMGSTFHLLVPLSLAHCICSHDPTWLTSTFQAVESYILEGRKKKSQKYEIHLNNHRSDCVNVTNTLGFLCLVNTSMFGA